MPHIAHSKKSFGIKNKTWLRTLCLFITATILVQDLTFGIEMYDTAVRGVRFLVGFGWIKSYEKDKTGTYFMLAYFLCFMILQLFVFAALKVAVDLRSYNIKFFKVWCAITVFTAVYVLNPWIITYKRNAEFIHRTLQYSYIAHTLAVPLHLLASSVVIYILWRMSKVKPDYNGEEPYEVIYGGQDSETKKLLDSK